MSAPGLGDLVEREAELARLHAVAAEVGAAGGVRLVLVTGEAGMGKSSLVLVFAGGRRSDPAWVVEQVDARRTDRSWTAPFASLVGDVVVDTVEGGPGERSPADELADAVDRRRRDLAGDASMLLVVEDLHFLDPVALRALGALLDRAADGPLLVVATARATAPDGDPGYEQALADLRAHPATSEVAVGPLTVTAVGDLLAADGHTAGAVARARVARALHRRTGGVPFLVEAAIAAGHAGDEAVDDVPWRVTELVVELLDDLGGSARSVAELVAVHGGPVPGRVLDGCIAGAADAAALLVRAGLAVVVPGDGSPAGARARSRRPAAGAVGLRHALIADAVLAALDPVARSLRHRQLADALRADDEVDPADLARHLAAAGDVRAAAPWAAQAADRLAVAGSHQRAVELYELALVHPPDVARRRAALFERASVAAGRAGLVERAGEWARTSYAALAGTDRGWEAGRGWTNTFVLAVRDALHDTAGGPVETAPVDDATVAAIADRYAASQVAIEAHDLATASRLATEADALAAAAGHLPGRVDAALSLIVCGQDVEAEAILDDVVATAEAQHDWRLASVAWSRRTRLHNLRGEPGVALRCLERAHRLAQRASGPDEWGSSAVLTAIMRAYAGDLDGAADLCTELESLEVPMVGDVARVARLVVAIERGDVAAADQQLTVLVPLVRALGIPYYTIPVLMLAARAAFLDGRRADAQALVDEVAAQQVGVHDFEHDLLVLTAVCGCEAADAAAVAGAGDRLVELRDRYGGPQLVAGATFVRGLGLRLAGDLAGAAASFADAADRWEQAPRLAFAADAWCAAATAALDVPDGDAAGACNRARSLAAHLRSPRLAWRVAQLDAATRAAAGAVENVAPGGLTPRERAVAAAAADGLTNREIAEALGLAEATVRNYLSSAFAKLGVRRRTELAAHLPQPPPDR